MTMNTEELVAIQDQGIKEAGALVWWDLQGPVDIDDLLETLAAEGIDTSWAPKVARLETVAHRAARAAITCNRELVRPLSKANSWEFVTEAVVEDGDDEKLEYTANVRIYVTKEGDESQVRIHPAADTDVAIAETIASKLAMYKSLLTATDMSNWLLWVLNKRVEAVSLRDRGGFYFVPNHSLETWRKVCAVVDAVSAHKMRSMPAMASEDAVGAILAAVRREAAAKFEKLDEYLAGDVSTRGLNSWEKSIEKLREKVGRYAELLGVNLEDLQGKSTLLLGGVQIARNLRDSAGEAAVA